MNSNQNLSEAHLEFAKGRQEEFLRAYLANGKNHCQAARQLGVNESTIRSALNSLRNNIPEDAAQLELPPVHIPKILYYDIETTNFNADFGEVLMFAYQWHGADDVHLVSVLDYPKSMTLPVEKRDRFLIQELATLLNQADIIVAHYGAKFDNKFVQARFAIHNMPYFDNRPNKMFDTCLVARKGMKIGSNRLANLAQAMGLPEEKTSLTKTQWRRANDYDTESLEAMGEYCKQDVRTLYEVAQRLRPLAKHLPSWLILNGEDEKCCHSCGGELQANGKWHTKANTYQRYQCTKCGSWQRGAQAIRKIPARDRVMY